MILMVGTLVQLNLPEVVIFFKFCVHKKIKTENF